MTIRLPPDQDITFPLVRILVMAQGLWTAQAWEVLPIPPRLTRAGSRYYGRRHGYELDSVENAALPEVGAAVFHFDYGSINGVEYDIDDDDSLTTARDLLGYDIRIQLAPAPASLTATAASAFSPAWKTVFLGTVIAQDDAPWTADQISQTLVGGGRRTYRCADLMWRTQRWPMNRHHAVIQEANTAASSANPRGFVHAYGHPGYNYAIQGYYRRLFGNRWAGAWPLSNGMSGSTMPDPFGDTPTNLENYVPHTWAGAGSTYATVWTDLQAVNHALASSRAYGEPCLSVKAGDNGGNATAVLTASRRAWEVNEGESCWDFINRILARQRARGLAKLWWSSHSDGSSLGTETDPSGPIYPFIVIYPQFYDDITFTPPGGTLQTFYGANPSSCNTSVAVDLIGDHRVPDKGIEYTGIETVAVDYLESFGEQIEILVTLSPGDRGTTEIGTLSKRWALADETTFRDIEDGKWWARALDRWKNVWQRWSIPPNWNYYVGNGNNETIHNINWYCSDSGVLTLYDLGRTTWTYDPTLRGVPSPLTSRILSDLPIYEGYNYATNATTRYDEAVDSISPPRLPPLIMVNYSDVYADACATLGAGMQNDDFGVFVTTANDLTDGTRTFGPTATSSVGYLNLVITVGLQLSHRVRFATASSSYIGPADSPRRKTLYFPGIHLWIADYLAIWSINYLTATNPNNVPPLRGCAGATAEAPGVIRDDRAALMSMHNLAWSWYSVSHRTARWEMRDCGLLPSFTNNDSAGVAGTVSYPTVGQFVTTVTAAVFFHSNTPITRIVYDATRGITTWFTDWCDLDQS